jgi:hypothetical protein
LYHYNTNFLFWIFNIAGWIWAFRVNIRHFIIIKIFIICITIFFKIILNFNLLFSLIMNFSLNIFLFWIRLRILIFIIKLIIQRCPCFLLKIRELMLIIIIEKFSCKCIVLLNIFHFDNIIRCTWFRFFITLIIIIILLIIVLFLLEVYIQMFFKVFLDIWFIHLLVVDSVSFILFLIRSIWLSLFVLTIIFK